LNNEKLALKDLKYVISDKIKKNINFISSEAVIE
jgi:hypothetical protein